MQNAMFDTTTGLLAKTTEFALMRHNVIAANLANVETPNYKAKDLPFSAQLKAAIARVEGRPTERLRFGRLEIVDDVTGEVRNDGNNVNNENEMIKLVKNAGLHTTAVELIRYKFSAIKAALATPN